MNDSGSIDYSPECLDETIESLELVLGALEGFKNTSSEIERHAIIHLLKHNFDVVGLRLKNFVGSCQFEQLEALRAYSEIKKDIDLMEKYEEMRKGVESPIRPYYISRK
jgi:hypothetical protein